MSKPLKDLDRLCIHTMTNKPWSLAECIEGYERAGVRTVTVWRNVLEPIGSATAGRMLRDSGLRVASLCRGGFFPADTKSKREAALEDNRLAIQEAAEIGAPVLVLVCGAVSGMDLAEARKWIAEGIATVIPFAKDHGVQLAIEPLHPMYADTRSAINTLSQANDIVQRIAEPNLGVVVDVYHLWWDPDLQLEIARANNWILGFHVSDWRVPTRDILNDRGLMGEGCIDIQRIRGWVEEAGFDGAIEVEIFSDGYWSMDQSKFIEKIKEAYLEHV